MKRDDFGISWNCAMELSTAVLFQGVVLLINFDCIYQIASSIASNFHEVGIEYQALKWLSCLGRQVLALSLAGADDDVVLNSESRV
jgi:hypothetical protein